MLKSATHAEVFDAADILSKTIMLHLMTCCSVCNMFRRACQACWWIGDDP